MIYNIPVWAPILYILRTIQSLCTCAYVKRKFVNVESMYQNLTGRKINEILQNFGELSGINSGDIKC